jgi:hypothetical protein
MPAIIEIRQPGASQSPSHFVVLLRVEESGVWVLDAPYSPFFVPDERLLAVWTGRIMIFPEGEEYAEQLRKLATERVAADWSYRLVLLALLTGLAALWHRKVITWGGSVVHLLPWRAAVSVIALAGLVIGMYCLWGQASQPPQCLFDQTMYYLGELPPGIVSHRIALRNPSRKPLLISGTRSSCTCATVIVPDTVGPGETAFLEVELSITPGPRGARLTVQSNDPEGPKSVMLAWHGKTGPELLPARIDVYQWRADRPCVRQLRLLYPSGPTAVRPRFVRCETDSPHVSVDPGEDRSSPAGLAVAGAPARITGEQELVVTIRPPSVPGRLTSKCILVYRYGEEEVRLTLPIAVQFWGGVTTPLASSVVFSAVRPAEIVGHERVIDVIHESDANALSIRDAPHWLHARAEPDALGNLELRLRVTGVPPRGCTEHMVTLVTGNGDRSITLTIFVCTVEP